MNERKREHEHIYSKVASSKGQYIRYWIDYRFVLNIVPRNNERPDDDFSFGFG